MALNGPGAGPVPQPAEFNENPPEDKGQASTQTKYWCFTEFKNTEALWPKVEVLFDNGQLIYAIAGRELCPRTGREHLQGFMILAERKRFNWVRTSVSSTARWSRMFSSIQACIDYCKKDGNYVEVGSAPEVTQGKRSDLEEVAAKVKGGIDMRSIAIHHPSSYIKYYRGITAFRNTVYSATSRRTPQIFYCFGVSGCGKSLKARLHCPPEKCCWTAAHCNGGWFDDYNDEETIVFDEFKDTINLQLMLKLLDQQPISLPTKGGFKACRAWCFFFTSNLDPRTMYPSAAPSEQAGWRRRFRDFGERVEPISYVDFKKAQAALDPERLNVLALAAGDAAGGAGLGGGGGVGPGVPGGGAGGGGAGPGAGRGGGPGAGARVPDAPPDGEEAWSQPDRRSDPDDLGVDEEPTLVCDSPNTIPGTPSPAVPPVPPPGGPGPLQRAYAQYLIEHDNDDDY